MRYWLKRLWWWLRRKPIGTTTVYINTISWDPTDSFVDIGYNPEGWTIHINENDDRVWDPELTGG